MCVCEMKATFCGVCHRRWRSIQIVANRTEPNWTEPNWTESKTKWTANWLL